jgi:eukaryotic-like serine/threonine-protein kinase
VLDFGVAQRLGDDFDPELTLPGTPEYMSPEQVEADPLDVRSDLYSLGVVLYECAAGELPFRGDQGFVLAMQRLLVAPRPIRDAAPQVPELLAGVVMRALELDPPRRWPDAQTMREALVGT